MIRGAILAAALLASGATTASAEVVFRGTIKITAVTPQCQNVSVNHVDQSVFHPKIAGNANFSGLSWVNSHYARGHQLDGRNFDENFRAVKSGGVGWGNTFSEDAAHSAQIKIIGYSPSISNIDAFNEFRPLRGQVKRLFNDPGGLLCVATFIGAYLKDSEQ